MSYPYGDDNYPTIERLETDVETLRRVFYDQWENLEQQLEDKSRHDAATRPITINIATTPETDTSELISEALRRAAEDAYQYAYPDTKDRIDAAGIAFARAMAAIGLNDPDNDLTRLFQDLFNVLEDRIISEADKRMQAAYDNQSDDTTEAS